ncbi:hypothetical protein [Nonomuraea africana]|uniref:Uncharacterized protein n=1 Tax=Nonomuraea africana TaxID=46171 RepID=A0ABR9KH60_9ACTN|nr:hypothetical protein [Nonomuraea africana]MBE1561352.1 hypothetical protein [Nonomuraea africana]
MTVTRGSTRTRKRRRTPPPDWNLPVLTDWGLKPEQQRLLVIIASVAGVLIAAVALTAAVAALGADAPDQSRQAAAPVSGELRPERFEGWASPKVFEPIAERAKDAKPLTEKELFAQKRLVGEHKISLKLTEKTLDTDCSAALWGEQLLSQVGDAGCTQAARAAYTSTDGRYLTQFTLLNLNDSKVAGELVESLKSLHRGGWVRPVTAFPPNAHTEGGAYALGHYVALVWLSRTDGAEPEQGDDFSNLALTVRGAEKPLYKRVVALTGTS